MAAELTRTAGTSIALLANATATARVAFGGQEAESCERPSHKSTLDVDYMRRHGRIAPYTCRAFNSARDVGIEHIVAYAEARKSGLSC